MITRFQPGDFMARDFEVCAVRCGGMGNIYFCYDHEFKMPFAVKTFRDQFLNDQISQERFIHEALTWSSLGAHWHIVRAFFTEQIDDKPYIFLEYVSSPSSAGPDLRSRLCQGHLPIEDALDFAIQFCVGMEYVQKRVPGLVHRDIKPENILIGEGWVLKITDFGLVKVFESSTDAFAPSGDEQVTRRRASLTRIGALLGTPPYMSPEQCQGVELDVRSDVYAFGCVLYEMVTGQYAFSVHTLGDFIRAHIYASPVPPRQVDSSVPAAVDYLVLKCLDKDPSKRFQGFEELRAALTVVYREVLGKDWKPPLEQQEEQDKAGEIAERVQNKFQMQADSFWDLPRGGRLNRYQSSWT